jgi:putative transcriptional regulator
MQRSKLREIRISKGLSSEHVANAVGVTENYITMIERGARRPSITLALKLEKFYGIPVSELLQQDNEGGGE